jgi:hypothetical protein
MLKTQRAAIGCRVNAAILANAVTLTATADTQKGGDERHSRKKNGWYVHGQSHHPKWGSRPGDATRRAIEIG